MTSSVGRTLHRETAAMRQHHLTAIDGGQTETAEVARNDTFHVGSHHTQAFSVGMHIVPDDLRIGIEEGVKVDEFHVLVARHLRYGFLDVPLPVARAGLKTRVMYAQGREERDEDAAGRVGHAEGVDECHVVGDEVVPEMRPVSGIGVIDAKMDDHDVGAEGQSPAEGFCMDIGFVATGKQRGTR